MVRNSATKVYKVQKKMDSKNKMFKDENYIREFMLPLKIKKLGGLSPLLVGTDKWS